jgi:hypothetical protein
METIREKEEVKEEAIDDSNIHEKVDEQCLEM